MNRGAGRKPRHVIAGALGGAVVVAVATTAWGRFGHVSPARSSALAAGPDFAAAAALPASPRPAFQPKRPVLLSHSRRETRWAPLIRPTTARSAPEASARPVADLKTETPEGTSNIVVVEAETTAGGTLWARVALPVLPNGTLGWIPRSALGGYEFVQTRLVVDREQLAATLLRNGRAVFRAPVGVGEPQWPTPAGTFYIRETLTKFRSPFYGPIAFGTNARSAVLTDWPGGGFIGIHGTDEPSLLPGRVSHGCIRLRNSDILELARLMPVGTPVTIE